MLEIRGIDVPLMTHWSERIYYSLAHDCDMARISGYDSESCCEHWIEIPTGRGFRDRRTEALERIQESIEAGDPAGEVPKG